jgi:hypothetical protein
MESNPQFRKNKQRGIVKTLMVIIIAIVFLKYALHINILAFFQNGNFNPYFDKIYRIIQGIMDSKIYPSILWVLKYLRIVWEVILKYWILIIKKAVSIGSKFFHTVPS